MRHKYGKYRAAGSDRMSNAVSTPLRKNMRPIPAGRFVMGSDAHHPEEAASCADRHPGALRRPGFLRRWVAGMLGRAVPATLVQVPVAP